MGKERDPKEERMRNLKRLTAWLLVTALLAGSSLGALAAPEGTPYAPKETVRAIVLLESAPLTEARADAAEDQAELFSETDYTARLAEEKAELFSVMEEEGVSFEVVYTFDTLVNGFSCDVAYGNLDALAKLPGVKSVHVANTYAPPEPVEPGITPYMAESNAITGNDLTLDEGYTGQGMVVAVLDSGVNLTHEAFQVYDGVLGTPKLTETAVNALIADEALGLPAGQYISEKIPFGYDYFDQDDDPSDTGTEASARGHGSHVSGIAVGYAETTDSETDAKTVTFSGAAPGAQLLAMKIYPSDGKGTTTDVYFKAMEDALKLGADVINVSLGVDNGFAHDPVLETELGGVFERLEEAGVLVCASAGNSNSMAAHPTKGYIDPLNTDYAIVGAPSTYGNNISVASMDNRAAARDAAEAPAAWTVGTMSDFSSWGPTPSLTLRPTITSIGGNVYSANWDNSAGAETYIPQWGTSMSSPNLAGTYASLLSFLADEAADSGQTRQERAAVARQLMESTAQVVRPEEDAAPYSPRKQGVGLANSVLARKAWASGWLKDPLQEVGDSREGTFPFRVTVKNNTAADITYATSAMVLTDSSELREDGHRQNTMTAKTLFDSTEGADALGLATVTMDGEVTVAAHSEQAVPVTVTLTDAGKAYFTENGFWSGGFVEGYIFLTPTEESPNAATLHATMLGYYGDWAQVSAADVQDFRSYLAAEYAYHTAGDTGEKTVYDFLDQPIATTVNVAYTYHSADGSSGELLGTNLMNGYDSEEESFRGEVQYAPYAPSHVLFSANSESCGYDWLYTQPSLLRNVRFIVMEVTDGEGNPWADYGYEPTPTGPHNNNYVSRALLSTNDGVERWYNFSNHHWFGKNAATGDAPADGTVLHVDLRAVMPYGADEANPYGKTQEHVWKTLTGYDEATGEPIYEEGFDFTVDSTAPQIVSAAYHAGEEGGDATLTVTVKDTHLAGVYLEENGVVVDYKLFDETTATLDDDGNWTATFSIPAEVEETEGNVVVYDYAFNKTAQTAAYEEAEEPTPSESPSPSPSESPSSSPSTNPGGNGGSGGGGGGGGTPATPPAAPTSTTTRADGAKVTTMNNSDGSTVVTVEQTDGTVSETVTAKSGEVTITVTGKDGDERAKVELPAVIPATQTRFDDVSADHWADEAIHKMAALELVNGVGGNRYDPAASMTRASFAAVLYRLSNGSAPGHELVFADVDQNGWCADSVVWADKNGIVTGIDSVGHRLFWPNDPITREQLAAMLCRYAKLIGIDTAADPKALEAFADGSSTGDWAEEGMAWCVESGILKGKGQNDLDPTANVTRAEAATMLNRFLALLK